MNAILEDGVDVVWLAGVFNELLPERRDVPRDTFLAVNLVECDGCAIGILGRHDANVGIASLEYDIDFLGFIIDEVAPVGILHSESGRSYDFRCGVFRGGIVGGQVIIEHMDFCFQEHTQEKNNEHEYNQE